MSTRRLSEVLFHTCKVRLSLAAGNMHDANGISGGVTMRCGVPHVRMSHQKLGPPPQPTVVSRCPREWHSLHLAAPPAGHLQWTEGKGLSYVIESECLAALGDVTICQRWPCRLPRTRARCRRIRWLVGPQWGLMCVPPVKKGQVPHNVTVSVDSEVKYRLEKAPLVENQGT